MGRLFLTACLGIVCLLAMAAGAMAYGLFTCHDPAGREVCVVDSGTRTDFVPSQLCNTTCPACAGRCDAVRRFAAGSGRWVETWRGAPGLGGDNRLVPGPDGGQDARTILRDGLVAPAPGPGRPSPPPGAPRERDLDQ